MSSSIFHAQLERLFRFEQLDSKLYADWPDGDNQCRPREITLENTTHRPRVV
ncbi:MAG TPA: hypothetical protein VD835_20435 [Pyrinomonadaceae bacterium]|nr:hypothetical protein [Pyrinomonadaceae bacterium]